MVYLIAYFSAKMSLAELNYDIQDRELLAIVRAFEEWRVYCERAKHMIEMLSDHKNLTGFIITKQLNRRQVR